MTASRAAEKMDTSAPSGTTGSVPKEKVKVRYMNAPVSLDMMQDFKQIKGDIKQVREILKKRREALGLSQSDLARALNIASPEFIGMVESGKRHFALNNIPALADVLKLNREDLCRLALFEEAPQFAMSIFGKAASDYGVRPVSRSAPVQGREYDNRQIDYQDKLWSLASPLRNTVLNLVDQFTGLQANKPVRMAKDIKD